MYDMCMTCACTHSFICTHAHSHSRLCRAELHKASYMRVRVASVHTVQPQLCIHESCSHMPTWGGMPAPSLCCTRSAAAPAVSTGNDQRLQARLHAQPHACVCVRARRCARHAAERDHGPPQAPASTAGASHGQEAGAAALLGCVR